MWSDTDNSMLTGVILVLEITLANSPGDSGTPLSDGEPEARQETKRAKSNATKDIYGSRVGGVFKKVDEKTSECRVCV